MTEKLTVNQLQEAIWSFGDDRPVWRAGQQARQLAIGLTEETSELLHCFRFSEEGEGFDEELADIFIAAFNFAEVTGVNVVEAVLSKLERMEDRYPVSSFLEGEFGSSYLEAKEMNR